MKVSDRQYFTLKRLHSLSGVFPVGLFLLEHFFTNAKALQGPEAFDKVVAELAGLPLVVLLEAFGIWLPILFHMVVGVLIATTSQSNLGKHGYARNWQYALQRASGVILIFYIVFHTFQTRFSGEYLNSVSAYQYVNQLLSGTGWFLFYLLGIVSACYHFGNGLFGFAIHWGLITGRKAQRVAARVGLVIFVGLAIVGVLTLLGFRGLRLDFLQKPHASEHARVVYEGGQH